MDVYVRDQLMKMLVWYFGVRTDFKKSPGKLGKYIKQDVEPGIWSELEKTFSDADFDHIWESLFTMGSLFRHLAKVVAVNFGFQYPQTDDENVSAFIRRIRNLPANAKEI
jgi:aminoglycoside 6-adenylyltransferase